MYKKIIRPILFLFNPELIHNLVSKIIILIQKIPLLSGLIGKIFIYNDPRLNKKVMGISFKNPVGVAAGFDKNGVMIDGLATFGFGFIEIGTVTPRPQPGNPLPRLFRLKKDNALINKMGFNNAGVDAVSRSLKKRKSNIIVGGNIGKNKNTPNNEAVNDYLKGFDSLNDLVDYFVINVSSPNTPGLRELQEKEPLLRILNSIQEVNQRKGGKPILVKIAPDLSNEQLDDIIDIVINVKLSGIVATNTTITRNQLLSDPQLINKAGNGGLSGMPLFRRSVEVVSYLRGKLGHDYVIIGVGGIMNSENAKIMIEAGADLIQLYTGFIYQGPGIAKRINKELVKYIRIQDN